MTEPQVQLGTSPPDKEGPSLANESANDKTSASDGSADSGRIKSSDESALDDVENFLQDAPPGCVLFWVGNRDISTQTCVRLDAVSLADTPQGLIPAGVFKEPANYLSWVKSVDHKVLIVLYDPDGNEILRFPLENDTGHRFFKKGFSHFRWKRMRS